MRQWIGAGGRAWAACAVVVLSGCVGMGGGARPTENPQRYDLGLSAIPAQDASRQSAAHEDAAVVLTIDAAPILADTGMLWRVGDSAAPQSYAQARWAATPAQLVRQRLVDYLSSDRHVLTESVLADVVQLRVTLTRFEQVFSQDGASSQGYVGLQAMLVQNRRVLASTRINTSAPATTQDAAGGVAALRQATDQAAKELAYWARVQQAPAKTR